MYLPVDKPRISHLGKLSPFEAAAPFMLSLSILMYICMLHGPAGAMGELTTPDNGGRKSVMFFRETRGCF